MKLYLQFVPSLRLLVTISILLFSFSSFAEIRYVSKTGTSIPPFISWSTAADSIQKCIDISNSGDTIYVGNGVYQEKIVFIRGLAIIGSGVDSCIIDTRTLVVTGGASVYVKDSCLIKNFKIITSTYKPQYAIPWVGYGIYDNQNGTPGYVTTIENMIIEDARTGIEIAFSNTLIKNNIISRTYWCIDVTASALNYYPRIIGNVISSAEYCIAHDLGTSPYFSNNIFQGRYGLWSGGYSGKMEFYNNLFIVSTNGAFLSDSTTFINNVITGNNYNTAIRPKATSIIKNNSFSNAYRVFDSGNPITPVIQYNNIWNYDILTPNNIPTPDSTNFFEDPMFVNDTSDFHLQMYSPLIDAGDPSILDKDGSRSDIGVFGGPLGESYTYQDLAPRPPVNLYCIYDTNNIFIKWNRNTESDFNSYNIYRDTTADFTTDSTKLISTQKDTFFIQNTPHNVNALYYKLTAIDNHGNESQPSEQISVILSNVNNNEPVTVYDYKLYQNYPNPFNPSTKISYILKERGYVKLMIYDLQGELLRVLVNETKERGYYEEEFNADGLSSGIYIYRIDVISSSKSIPVYSDVRKMIFIK